MPFSFLIESLEARITPAFTGPFDIGLVSGPVIAGDVNNDGIVDIIHGQGSGQVGVRLGNGDGTFQPPIESPAGVTVSHIAVGDINADGTLDLAVAQESRPGKFSVLRGNGDGTFALLQTITLPNLGSTHTPTGPAGSGPIAIADITGDGRGDVITTGWVLGSGIGAPSSFILVYSGNANGTVSFGSSTFSTVVQPVKLALADCNGDNRPDVLVTGRVAINGVSLYLHPAGAGGSVGELQTVGSAIGAAGNIAVEDFNNDDKLDIAVNNRQFLGNGDATFQAGLSIAAGTDVRGLAAADFTGDGVVDLITAHSADDHIKLFAGNGDATFADAVALSLGPDISRLTHGDFDGNGRMDLAFVQQDAGNVETLRVLLAESNSLPPAIIASHAALATRPHALVFTFSQDVSASLEVSDLLLENLTTGTTIAAGDLALSYQTSTNTAIVTYIGDASGISGVFADANYRATLVASGITNSAGMPMSADVTLDFLFLLGDANGDGRVNLADFNILAANFGQSGPGIDFTKGDFNYDGIVNLADFNILAARFGQVPGAMPVRSSLQGPFSTHETRVGLGRVLFGEDEVV